MVLILAYISAIHVWQKFKEWKYDDFSFKYLTLFFRWERACTEENFYKMGEFSLSPYQLPNYRSLHRFARWQISHQIIGNSFRRTPAQTHQGLFFIMSTKYDKKHFRLKVWLHWSQKWIRFFHETCYMAKNSCQKVPRSDLQSRF